MGRNLPPGVSVSDLPGSGPEPECRHCGNYPSPDAMADGYPLCEEHDTEDARERYDAYEERKRREAKLRRKREQRQREESPPEEVVEKNRQALIERYRGPLDEDDGRGEDDDGDAP